MVINMWMFMPLAHRHGMTHGVTLVVHGGLMFGSIAVIRAHVNALASEGPAIG